MRRHRPLGRLLLRRNLTDQMEAQIEAVIAKIDAAGGMYKAAESGVVQAMIGQSALAFQEKVEAGEQKVVGVNCYLDEEDGRSIQATERPDPARMREHVARFKAYKEERSGEDAAQPRVRCARPRGKQPDREYLRQSGGGRRTGRHARRDRRLLAPRIGLWATPHRRVNARPKSTVSQA